MTYHYTMCGLDYVYLRSGFREHETDYGAGISIEHADDLDTAIAAIIISSHARLRGQEVRFLRSLTQYSQTEIANLLGVKRVTVARWESSPNTPIPGPADRLLRLISANYICDEDGIKLIISLLSEIADEDPELLIMSYLPDEAPPEEETLFPEIKPVTDGWKPAKRVA